MQRLIFAFILLMLIGPSHAWGKAKSQTSGQTADVADVVVRDQDDRDLHFYSDLLKGRIVAINFIFTGCSTVCPLSGAHFAALQAMLGKADNAVSLISVSLDPLNDTPVKSAAGKRTFASVQLRNQG